MTKQARKRLCIAERNVHALAHRVGQLEEEMAICLRWMRVQVERELENRSRLFDAARSTKPIPS